MQDTDVTLLESRRLKVDGRRVRVIALSHDGDDTLCEVMDGTETLVVPKADIKPLHPNVAKHRALLQKLINSQTIRIGRKYRFNSNFGIHVGNGSTVEVTGIELCFTRGGVKDYLPGDYHTDNLEFDVAVDPKPDGSARYRWKARYGELFRTEKGRLCEHP